MDDNMMVCECYDIRVKDIKKAIADGNDTFEKMERCMRLGILCGACIKSAKAVIAELKKD
ncbi:MAG: (2Fe-2S)-binding protein [Firmicutes bacterium]|nr:(2Fe-2S)-binding protein [Bacillota bacterium]